MKKVNIHEAKTNFSKLLNYALEGGEVIIAKAGKPIAEIVPIREKRGMKRTAGLFKDIIELYKDIEKPLPEKIVKEFYK